MCMLYLEVVVNVLGGWIYVALIVAGSLSWIERRLDNWLNEKLME